MLVQHSPTGRVAVVIPSGELDIAQSHGLRRVLLDLIGTPLIVVDLAAVTFVDSTILGVLVGAARRAGTKSGRLVIVNAQGSPARAIRITGLGFLLSPADGLQDVPTGSSLRDLAG